MGSTPTTLLVTAMSPVSVVCMVVFLLAIPGKADTETGGISAGLQKVFGRLQDFQRFEKRRPSEMSRNGFGANAFSGDFGQFYTMKRSDPRSVGPLLSLLTKRCGDGRSPRHLVATLCGK